MQQTVIFLSLRPVHTSNKVAEKGDKVAENGNKLSLEAAT